MLLNKKDRDLFFRIIFALMFIANRRLKVVGKIKSPKDLQGVDSGKLTKLRDEIINNPSIVDELIADEDSEFTEQELSVSYAWKKAIQGKFFIYRDLKNYTVFLSEYEKNRPVKAYGVLGLNTEFRDSIPFMPFMVNAVLLPYKGNIVADGLFGYYDIHFGSGMRESMDEVYKTAKKEYGIITSL